ncbi:MAG: 50S ribosomal protein L17 [Ardenticatenaceae bacterium]|nr:50S ribosomal protein L17 [Ardenticatenaceae bacterium]MCB9442718.1 50S ribosomal protein L17 [Ardenticatenaceae bacterium]
MRHRVSGRKLGRDTSHRNALRKNMIADLICHEQILTTEGKARMLRPAAEKIITLAKRGLAKGAEDPAYTVHARRLAATRVARVREYEDEKGYLEEVDVVKKLFDEIAPRYAERNGGYTRMIKVGKRPGDNADMAILMLVEKE